MQLHRLPVTPEIEARIWNRMARDDFEHTLPTMPAPLSCSGNCNQGRACDCAQNLPDDYEPTPTRWLVEHLALLVLAWALVAACVLIAWRVKP